ncbi:unnamed protein product [Zymoseptoria tritici ST99CH_1A5]|uniref:Methyltransferase n=1 Tax=Zymoseptoria tritici ST99CH_1A5 TaxID=1276529 RepID=A0A1Y6LX55_ZYMTR|nr:unnamed protein product [Zymoseptoria tritici ST99CH_1A5]
MTGASGQFNYLQWDSKFEDEKPYYLYTDPPPGEPNANFVTRPGEPEHVHDVRGREKEFNLDDHAFAFGHQVYPNLRDLNDATIQAEYMPSLEKHIRDLLKQEAVIFWFDWRIRSSDEAKSKYPEGTKISLGDRMTTLAPIKAVHVDQTPAATLDRVHRHAPHMVDQLPDKRVRIINIWRPIGHPVESNPLAFMDGSTVPDDKLIEVDVVRRTFLGESYYPLEGGGYRWHFMDHQTSDELLFMKMSDSNQDVKAKCCPHASFRQTDDPNARPRESIEVRALVFTDH